MSTANVRTNNQRGGVTAAEVNGAPQPRPRKVGPLEAEAIVAGAAEMRRLELRHNNEAIEAYERGEAAVKAARAADEAGGKSE